ncbi:hypothetical protein [Nocardia anaemiae]|uniref:hypothetical protein n=1 Tax=Nocardia anaemiae TaxID=263910 RepID=UPI0007A4A0B2|nr:hypothetical protein [Nocardia anaemiae]
MRDKQSTGRSEIAALTERVANARGRLPLQDDAALVQALSDAEIDAERELAQWVRAQRRGQRKRAVQDELAAEKRNRRTMSAIQRADDADARWHRRALAARRRVSNQDARLAQLYRRAEWSSRALIAVVVLGMVWAGVNVQHNLVPSGNMADPLYWLSYGIEAMISIPIITIMVAATTAARWGRELDRGKVVFFETALLGTTVALNAGPHLAAGAFGQAAEYAIAPVMVGVVIWLHAWVSARYALLIDGVPIVENEPEPPPRHRVTTERGAPIDTFHDDPIDRRELLAAKGFDPMLDQAGVRFPVDMDTHVAEAAMRAAQPDAVPVSRLDCTETLVYHAQSTRSTNGRLTQPIPSENYRSAHTTRTSDPVQDTATTFTGAQPAHPSATNTGGEKAFHANDFDLRTASVSGSTPHATAHPGAAMGTRVGHAPTATSGFEPDTAATATDDRTTFATTGFEPRPAAPSATNPGIRHTTDSAPQTMSMTADARPTLATTGLDPQTGSDERTTFATTGVQHRTEAPNAAGTRDEHTTVAATGFAPHDASVTAADEPTAFTDTGIAPRTAAPSAASTRDEHTIVAATGFDAQTAVTGADERTSGADIGSSSGTTASARDGASGERTAPAAGTPSAAGDGATSPATRIRNAAAADARNERTTALATDPTTAASTRDVRSARDVGATSIVGAVENVGTRPAAQSQLSIFDTAIVETSSGTVDATADQAMADTSRATASPAAAGTATPADVRHPANSGTRTETSSRTSAAADAAHESSPIEPQRATRGSATPTPAEQVTRAMEVHRTSSTDNSATDRVDQTAESEAEIEQLVPDDAPRRTTSEVISEVVQSLSAENLLTENLGSESDDIEVWSVARAIAGRGLSVIPVEQLAEILMLADQSWTPTSIGAEVGLSRTAIAQVLEFARRVRRPYAISS